MPEIESECVFEVNSDDIKFTTKTNGDIVIIRNLDFSKEQAASFAWLVNHPGTLRFEVKLA